MLKLWVDDERVMPWDHDVAHHVHAKTSEEAIRWLNVWKTINIAYGHPLGHRIDEVSLDHDLGGDDTGFKVLDWMINLKVWPRELTIHTANSVARKRMLAAANAEAPDWVLISVIYDHLVS